MSDFSADALFEHLCEDLAASYPPQVSASAVPGDVVEFAKQEMRNKFLSKLIPRASSAADMCAYNSFVDANQHCYDYDLVSALKTMNSYDQQLVGEFQRILDGFFLANLGEDLDLNWGNIALHARCGPGVSHGSRGTSHYEKYYAGPLAASSSSLVDLYHADIRLWSEESIAESIRRENFGSIRIVRSSKAYFVPKTAKTSRLIASEPGINMWYQLGVGRILEKRLVRYFGIDLSTQPDINRYLAKLGSTLPNGSDNGFATIDLKSASDCISLSFAGNFFPAEWNDVLLTLRSRSMDLIHPVTRVKETHELNMLSTMGNGFTFPLQTAIFASIACACTSSDYNTREMIYAANSTGGLWSVFGDDIIVPTKAYHRTLRLLTQLGFWPNENKSFGSGWFRESCGHDYYQGYNVRPVFCRKAETNADITVLFNQLAIWSCNLGIDIPSSLEYLLEWLGSLGGAFPVPLHDNVDAGIRVPLSLLHDRHLVRDPHVQSIKYRHRVAEPKRLRFTDRTCRIVGRRGKILYNIAGALLSTLRGELRSGIISIRGNNVEYRTKSAIVPCWDYCTGADVGLNNLTSVMASYPQRLHRILSNLDRLYAILKFS